MQLTYGTRLELTPVAHHRPADVSSGSFAISRRWNRQISTVRPLRSTRSVRLRISARIQIDRRRHLEELFRRQLEEEKRRAESAVTCPVDCVREVRTMADLETELLVAEQNKQLVVVDFYNSACGSCKYILPSFIDLCKSGCQGDSECAVNGFDTATNIQTPDGVAIEGVQGDCEGDSECAVNGLDTADNIFTPNKITPGGITPDIITPDSLGLNGASPHGVTASGVTTLQIKEEGGMGETMTMAEAGAEADNEAVRQEFSAVRFLKHNIRDDYDDLTEIAILYRIKLVPAFAFFKDGTRVGQLSTRNTARVAAALATLLAGQRLVL